MIRRPSREEIDAIQLPDDGDWDEYRNAVETYISP